MLRSEIIPVVRSYIGTPFRHQGRLKGPYGGVDCVGLLWGAAHELGYAVGEDFTGYHRLPPDTYTLDELMSKWLISLPRNSGMQGVPGDMLLMRYNNHPTHAGFLSRLEVSGTRVYSVIHAFYLMGRVVETSLDAAHDVVGVYRFPSPPLEED